MRCFRRGILTAAGLSLVLALGGCGSLGSLDPSDWFDFNKKTPIPGERQLVFPEGVPGVPQGVPPELVAGSQPAAADPGMVATAEAGQPAGAPQAIVSAGAPSEARPEPAVKPKPRVAARPKQPAKPNQPPAQAAAHRSKSKPTAAQPAAQTAGGQSADQGSSVWGQHPTQQGANAPWPASSTQQRAPAPWPDAPNPNQFSQ